MRRWSQDELTAAVAALRTSKTVAEALQEISRRIRPVNDAHALANAFERNGLGAPSSHLGQALVLPAEPRMPSILPPPPQQRVELPSPLALRTIMAWPDTHVPNHDQRAFDVALNAAALLRPDELVILGDFIDNESMSGHVRPPDRERFLAREIEAGNKALDRISALGISCVTFLLGNHEERAERYISTRAPELFGLISIPELLQFRERGWDWRPYRDHIKIGKIGFAHDIGFCGKGTAASSLAAFGSSIVVGHSHRAQIMYGGDVQGERHVAVNSGWLGSVKKAAGYMHRSAAERDWQLGFTWIKMTPDGIGWCQFIPIINGRCVVDGQLIRS